MAKQKRLFTRLDSMEPSALMDNIYAAAYELEDLLLASGAVPGEDYTRLDLIEQVRPYVMYWFKKHPEVELWSFPASDI